MLMKKKSVSAAVNAMLESGLDLDYETAYNKIFDIS